MELRNEFSTIRQWAKEKGIYESGDIKTQYVKLQEEAGELAKAIINSDREEIIDAIGDMVVVLTSVAELANKEFPDQTKIRIEDCINSAYDVIAKRKGKMENGSFIKDA